MRYLMIFILVAATLVWSGKTHAQSRAYEVSLSDFAAFTLIGPRAENLDSVNVAISREIFDDPRSRLNETSAVRFNADELVRGTRQSTNGANRGRLRVEPRQVFSVREAVDIQDLRLNAVPGDMITITIEARASSRRSANRVRFFLPEILGNAPRRCGAENEFAVSIVDNVIVVDAMETTPEMEGRFAIEFSGSASLCIRRIEGGGPYTMQLKASRMIDGVSSIRCLTGALPTNARATTASAQYDICADPGNEDQSALFAVQSFQITSTSSGVVIRDRYDRCASFRFPETQTLIFEPCNLFYRGIYWRPERARSAGAVTLENRETTQCFSVDPTGFFTLRGDPVAGPCASVPDRGWRATITLRQYQTSDRNDRLSFIDYERTVRPFGAN
ncbi:MAG: hypothetical protein AAFW83_13265 [Pseudomonadota bacterium]